MIGAGIAVAVAGDGGDGSTTSTPVVSSTPDTFYATLGRPASVRVTAVGDGTFTVEVGPVDGATAYEIQPVGAEVEPVTVAAADLPGTVTATGVPNLCVVVRAVGEGGRISRDSAPACSG